MEILHQGFNVLFHLDQHLAQWAGLLGPWVYLMLFGIVFCETGLVVTPVLPGDSLLFAVGALAALDSPPFNVRLAALCLCLAAVSGDAVNYAIGRRVGPRVFTSEDSRFLNKRHLIRTQEFYDKHGGKTIILARFMPIIRTFAPFVAGIGKMRYARFAAFNVVGGIAWVTAFVYGGYFFGNIPVVKRNFHIVIGVIILISIIPPAIELVRARRQTVAPALSE